MPSARTVSVRTNDGLDYTFDADDFLIKENGVVCVLDHSEAVAVFAAGTWTAVYFTASAVAA